MMQTLRKYMKHILWIVALAFIATLVFSWGMGGFKNRHSDLENGVVGIINGQKIQWQQFRQMLDQELEKTKAQYPDTEIPESRQKALNDQVWQTLVRDVIIGQEIKRMGIKASDEEVVFVLQNMPPDFLQSQEEFQTNGQFDMTKYQQALSDPRNYNAWIPVENYLRSIIPAQKLTQRMLSTVRVSDSEAREAYRLENRKANVRYLFFDPNRISLENINISEDEINAYYAKHKEEFTDPEKRKIEYVKFEGKPSAEDSLQVKNDILHLLDLIHDGADFATLAQENSEDASASQGGDLGFFGRGQMVKPFEDAAFGAKIGEVVGPVQTQYGMHLIKVVARKTESGEMQVQARHILIRYKASPETIDSNNDRAQYLWEELDKEGGSHFAELATEEGLEITETPFFPAGGFIPGIGMASRISYYAFSEKKGWVSRPMPQGDDIIVFRITGIEKKRTKPVEEVRTSIERVIEREKKMEEAGRLCAALVEKIKAGASFERAAASDSLQIKDTGPFSLQGYVPEIGKDAAFNGAAFRLSSGEISGPVKGTRGYYILKQVEISDINEDSFNAVKEERRQALLQQKMQQVYFSWYSELHEKAKIKDNRDLFF